METIHMRPSSLSGRGYESNADGNFEAEIGHVSYTTHDGQESAAKRFLQEYYSKAMYQRTSRLAVAAKETISSSEGRVTSINSLAVVISFIAAVQSTIILITITGDGTALSRTANTIAFLGIILDVTGALTGLEHAFHLQHVIKDQTKILGVITEFDADITSIREWLTRQLEPRRSEARIEHDNIFHSFPIEDILKRAIERMESFYEEDTKRQEWSSVNELFQVASQSMSMRTGRFNSLMLLYYGVFSTTALGDIAEFGAAPIRAMVLGSLCLLVSTILLAARDLHRETWIACLVVGFYAYEASMVARFRQKALEFFKGRVGASEITSNVHSSSVRSTGPEHQERALGSIEIYN